MPTFGSTDVFLHNPSAASLVQIGTSTKYMLDNRFEIDLAEVTVCDIQCYRNCTDQVWTVTFQDVDFGDCNACSKVIQLNFNKQRNPRFDNETWLKLDTDISISYDGIDNGIVTATDIAASFAQIIQEKFFENNANFFNGMTASATGAVLTLSFPCTFGHLTTSNGVTFTRNNNLLSTELPVIVNTVPFVPGKLDRYELLQEHPLNADYVTGGVPGRSFTFCETTCVLNLEDCIPACEAEFSPMIGGSVGVKRGWKIYLNGGAAGYTAFISALQAAASECDFSTADATPDVQPAQVYNTDIQNMGAGDGLVAG